MAALSRRELFRRFGPSALLLYPILSARVGRGDPVVKKRLMVSMTSSGVIQSAFWPTGSSSNYSLAGTSLAPLQAFVPHLNIARGVFNDWNGGDSHSAGTVALLTGNRINTAHSHNGRTDVIPGNLFAYNASIDQIYAASLSGQTPVNSLVLAIQPTYDRPSRYISYNADGTYVPQSTNPYTVFTSVFQPLVQSCTPEGQAQVIALRNLAIRRKSILDANLGDLNDAARLSGLNATEKAKLDSYTAAVTQMEQALAAIPVVPSNPSCATLSAFFAPPVPVDNAHYAAVARLMLDLVVAAFQLDVTRVATLVWDVGGNNGVPSVWESFNGSPIEQGYHDLTHQSDPSHWVEKCKILDTYHAQEFAYLLGQLQASP